MDKKTQIELKFLWMDDWCKQQYTVLHMYSVCFLRISIPYLKSFHYHNQLGPGIELQLMNQPPHIAWCQVTNRTQWDGDDPWICDSDPQMSVSPPTNPGTVATAKKHSWSAKKPSLHPWNLAMTPASLMITSFSHQVSTNFTIYSVQWSQLSYQPSTNNPSPHPYRLWCHDYRPICLWHGNSTIDTGHIGMGTSAQPFVMPEVTETPSCHDMWWKKMQCTRKNRRCHAAHFSAKVIWLGRRFVYVFWHRGSNLAPFTRDLGDSPEAHFHNYFHLANKRKIQDSI